MQLHPAIRKGQKMKVIRSTKDANPEKGLLFFDIETTGLSAQTSCVYLIGYMRREEDKCVLTQLFCEDMSEEEEMLKVFASELSHEETLVHFNGAGFDIPYLNKKFKKYGIDRYIDAEKTRDLYKEILHFKKYLPTDNLKLKTIEAAAGFSRKDTFDGAELIKIYSELLGRIRLASITKKEEDVNRVEEMTAALLLHNSDDIEGLLEVYGKTNISSALSGFLSPKVDVDAFELTLTYPVPLFPAETELSLPKLRMNNGRNATEISIPIKHGELKYFFPDYKNYTYIIDRDMCMHNSVVSGVSKENKKKCTKETAYIRKYGDFIPIPTALADLADERRLRLFKENFNDKTFYIELPKDMTFINEYVICLLNEL